MVLTKKKCIVCGKEFKPTRRGQVTCSEPCRRKLADYGWLTDGSKKNKTLTEAAVEAKKAGESYGQYKARLWLEEQKRREERSDES